MNCLVTAGPTYEPLDEVRRLTNFSTGRLGTELANFLVAHGHEVTLLLGAQATWSGERRAQRIRRFTTTADLQAQLAALSSEPIDAVFHAAAVSDFAFGKTWSRSPSGELSEVQARKISSQLHSLLVELKPTPKLLAGLRDCFPRGRLVGWKYEVDGDRARALAQGQRQIAVNRTDACVLNGPAYGAGFALLTPAGQHSHLADGPALFAALEEWLWLPFPPPSRGAGAV